MPARRAWLRTMFFLLDGSLAIGVLAFIEAKKNPIIYMIGFFLAKTSPS